MTTELKPGDVEIIFAASPINGGVYPGHYLPVRAWDWPKQTWLQQRLEKIRKEQNEQTFSPRM